MANRYWVGGTGTWNTTSTTNWSTSSGGASGASVPGTNDAVIFDANSNTGTNDFTVTIGASVNCQTLNTTGIDPATAMTVAGTNNLTVTGNTFTLTNKVSWTNTGTLSFTQTGNNTINITTAAVSIASNISVGGGSTTTTTFNFVDNFTTTGSFTWVRGALTTTGSNKAVTVATFVSTGSIARTMNLGGSASLSITGNNATVWNTGAATNVTWTSPGISFTYSGSVGTRTVNAGTTTLPFVPCSITAGSDTFVFTASDIVGTVNFTGFSGTWNNVTLSVYGDIVISTGMTVGSGNGIVTMGGPVQSSITTNGKTLDFPLTINNSPSLVSLVDNCTLGSTRAFTLTGGTLRLAGKLLTTGIFSSSGTTSREIEFSSRIVLTGNNATILDFGVATNLVFSISTPYFESTYTGSVGTRTFNCTGLTEAQSLNVKTSGINALVLSSTATDTIELTGSYNNFDLTGFVGTLANTTRTIYGDFTLPASGGTFSSGTNVTTFGKTGATNIQYLVSNGRTLDFPITKTGTGDLYSSGDTTIGSSRTLTHISGSIYVDPAFSTFLSVGFYVGTGSSIRALYFNASGLGLGLQLTGNNGTIFDLSTATNFSYTGIAYISSTYTGSTGTRTFNTSGLTESNAFNASVTGSSGIVLNNTATDAVALTGSYGSVDLTGLSSSFANTTRTIYGNFTVGSSVTVTAGTSITTFGKTSGTQTITSNGVLLDFPITISGVGGTVSLGGALSIGSLRTLTLTNGTFTANNYNVTVGLFSSSNANTRTLTLGSGAWTLSGVGTVWNTATTTNLTFNKNTANITLSDTSTTARTFAGGGLTYNNLVIGGTTGVSTLTITGANTFDTLSSTKTVAHTITFPSGVTNTFSNFSLSGTAGNLITIQSSTPGTRATISKTSGTVSVSYLSIKDSAATGGATWEALTANGNIDTGNNTGWIFGSVTNFGSFLIFFQ